MTHNANKMTFCFGSNTVGAHGKGAALDAYKRHGARYGQSYGHYGNSFAIPTMDGELKQLPLNQIRGYVEGFLAYARDKPEMVFQMTCIGTGLAGYRDEEIAPLFKDAPPNVWFDTRWEPYLGENRNYWGSWNRL